MGRAWWSEDIATLERDVSPLLFPFSGAECSSVDGDRQEPLGIPHAFPMINSILEREMLFKGSPRICLEPQWVRSTEQDRRSAGAWANRLAQLT